MQTDQFRGVNLGGWLVLERWMTPDVFDGTNCIDEYSLSQQTGAKNRIEKHHKDFITDEDFEWIAANGFSHIRLPIGFWLFGDAAPYIGCHKFVSYAMAQAEKHQLRVLLDIHALPGSQNGKAHSGRAGDIYWPKEQLNIDESLRFLERLCREYGKSPALEAIGLINEPDKCIPLDVLSNYYKAGQGIVNKFCSKDVRVVVSDGFRLGRMVRELRRVKITGVTLEVHHYQTHSLLDRLLGFKRNLRKVKKWGRQIVRAQRFFPVIVGEWSGGLGINKKELSRSGKLEITKKYLNAQLTAYSGAEGWYYWSYKVATTEDLNPWGLRGLVDNGLVRI